MSNDRLPSWSDGAAKAAILDFVAGVIKEGGIDLIRSFSEERYGILLDPTTWSRSMP